MSYRRLRPLDVDPSSLVSMGVRDLCALNNEHPPFSFQKDLGLPGPVMARGPSLASFFGFDSGGNGGAPSGYAGGPS